MRVLLVSIGSRQRESTLRFSAEVIKALQAETTMLGVVDKDRKVKDLTRVLETAAKELAALDLPVTVRVEVGQAEEIVAAETAEETYDLIALGALGSKRSRLSFLSSVGMHIIEQARNSVLVVKGERQDLSRVLICASGTEQGHLSVWAGAAIACGAQAKATLLHVVTGMPAMYAGLEQMEETLSELLQSETERARELKWAAQVVRAECDISEVKLRRGLVADEILREAQEGNYDLVVLGSSQYSGGLVRVLMGDLAREVVSRAECPVLVVRPMD